MSTPPARPAPLAGTAVAGVVVALAAWVLALVRPWGDTGVDADGSLTFGRPDVVLGWLGAVVVVTAVVAVATARRTGRWAARRFVLLTGGLVVMLAAVALVVVLAVTTAQLLPRDGGWWGLLTAVATGVAGIAVCVTGFVRPAGRRTGLVTLAVAVVVPVALVVAGVVVAPGWAGHVVDGAYPATFSESPGPSTVTRVGWRQDFGTGTTTAVLGGRVVVARDTGSGHDCRLTVRALDAGSGAQVWSSARTLRCDGPRLAALDGDNATVRLTLRGTTAAGDELAGPPLMLYLGLEDGRDFTPSSALGQVQWWTEGFGLVRSGSEVRGLDTRTGVTIWSRPVPRCADGTEAALQLPSALPAGELASRSPYDLGAPFGTVPVAGVGNDIVFATSCAENGTTVRRVWLVDVLNGVTADRITTLPSFGQLDAAVPTTFLTWLDTVVAAVPVAAPSHGSVAAAMVGLDLASGKVLWQRPPASLTTVDLSPTDGSVRASTAVTGPGSAARTVVLDVHTGEVLADRQVDVAPQASVALTGGRLEYGSVDGASVVDPVTGEQKAAFAVPDCVADLRSGAAPLLAGPGGVVVRCEPKDAGGASVVGLAS